VADLAGGAVLVFNALWRGKGNARSVGVTGVSNLAAALSKVLADEAVGVFGARISGLARVDAVPVLASTGQRTLRIGPASDGNASGERITFVSVDAAAVGDVALGVAFGVGAARIVQETGVDALAVAAGLPVLTLGVGLAADRLALDLWVADGALGALAHGPVVRQEALSPLATVTRVHADTVDASIVLFALVVTNAAWWVGGFYRDAAPVSVRYPAFSTRADHSSEGNGVDH